MFRLFPFRLQSVHIFFRDGYDALCHRLELLAWRWFWLRLFIHGRVILVYAVAKMAFLSLNILSHTPDSSEG